MKKFFQSVLRFLGLAKDSEPVSVITELVSYDDDISEPKADDYFLADKDSPEAVAAAPPEIMAVIVDATPSPDPVPTIAEIEAPDVQAPKKFFDDDGNQIISAYLKEVPDLRTENGFALDLHVEGVASLENGFSSFQIDDFILAPGIELLAYDKGSILRGTPDGLGGYITRGPFVSGGIIDFANERSYNVARFGGYGSSKHAVRVDGTLYRFYFSGNHSKGTVTLDNFRMGQGLGNYGLVYDPVRY